MSLYTTITTDLRRMLKDAQNNSLRGKRSTSRDEMTMMALLSSWIMEHNTLAQWNAAEGLNGNTASSAAPAGGARSYTAEVDVTDASNIANYFDQSSQVTVSITGGTASGKKINGATAPVVLTMRDGKATCLASATGTGTIILGLSAPAPASLDIADALTITLS